jgi:hypothetical protein
VRNREEWIERPGLVLAFGRILAAYYEWEVSDVFYYFEKPWKWTPEHERWRALGMPGRPEPGALDAPEEDTDDE